MTLRTSHYNYSDQTPNVLADFLFINSMDIEEISLFGVKTIYYKLNQFQENFDPVFRDLLSSKNFLDPIELYSYFKVEEATTHGVDVVGSSQVAERTGDIWFNISSLEHILGRTPVIGDVVADTQIHQMFEIFGISKELFRLGRTLRYHMKVRLYQNQAGFDTYNKPK